MSNLNPHSSHFITVFINYIQYLWFVLQTIPVALAKIRNAHGLCPKESLAFLVDLIKYNDNNRNKVSVQPIFNMCLVYVYLCNSYYLQQSHMNILKVPIPKSFENNFVKLTDRAIFYITVSSMVKKFKICISFAINQRKQCFCYLLFYKIVETIFFFFFKFWRWFITDLYLHRICA